MVILNLSADAQPITLKEKTLNGKVYNVFKGDNETLTCKGWEMKPWGYAVYEYR